MLMSTSSIEYLRVTKALVEQRNSFTFEASDYSGLPRGQSTHGIFVAAIRRDQDEPIAGVLNDLFRYLYYSNFAGEGVDLDQEFPFRETIPEGRSFAAGAHLSQRTDTVGSALYLLIKTRATTEPKALLGAVVLAMARHPKYGGTAVHPLVPVIDERKVAVNRLESDAQ